MIETFKAALTKNNVQCIQYNLAFMNIHDSIGEDYPIHDDMEKINTSLDECDYVVFASPLYYFSFSGYLKCAIDRLSPSNNTSKNLACLISMESDDENILTPLKEQSKLIASCLSWNLLSFLYIKDCKKPTKLDEHVAELERVYQLGLKIK